MENTLILLCWWLKLLMILSSFLFIVGVLLSLEFLWDTRALGLTGFGQPDLAYMCLVLFNGVFAALNQLQAGN